MAHGADQGLAANLRRIRAELNAAASGEHVCPTLKRSLASQFEMLAKMAALLADEARGQGYAAHAVTAGDIAALAETISAEIEADLPEGA